MHLSAQKLFQSGRTLKWTPRLKQLSISLCLPRILKAPTSRGPGTTSFPLAIKTDRSCWGFGSARVLAGALVLRCGLSCQELQHSGLLGHIYSYLGRKRGFQQRETLSPSPGASRQQLLWEKREVRTLLPVSFSLFLVARTERRKLCRPAWAPSVPLEESGRLSVCVMPPRALGWGEELLWCPQQDVMLKYCGERGDVVRKV